jgi:hypothetical protein
VDALEPNPFEPDAFDAEAPESSALASTVGSGAGPFDESSPHPASPDVSATAPITARRARRKLVAGVAVTVVVSCRTFARGKSDPIAMAA